jgi:hypothetical protein
MISLWVLPVEASGAVLYDQTGGPSTGSFSSSNFGVANQVSQGADDFTVPAGATWQISSVSVFGSGLLTGSPTAAVFLYPNAGSLPGAQLFSQSGIPISGVNNFTIPISSAPQLGPGTYWIGVRITDPVQWSWAAEGPQFGSIAVWRNPADGYGTGCTDFAALNSCFVTSSKSFLFRLDAADTVPPATPPSTTTTTKKKKCKKKKHKRAASAKKRKCKKHKKR